MDTHRQQRAERQEQERKEAAELPAEAVQQLSPDEGGIFGRMRQSAFGRYRGRDSQRYTITEHHRCWLLASVEGVHPETEICYDSPILLLENATVVRVWQDFRGGAPNEFASSLEPTPVGQDYFPMLGADKNWVGELRKRLGEAFVRYERGAVNADG
ncbi:hypothetical protein [Streptomyces sp. HUAS TT7]|uniref:hypothetical protein n=1 Tax=Streptomyces sp. HUAS TT7 TaxID=3447507 RepID=UPI003F65E223